MHFIYNFIEVIFGKYPFVKCFAPYAPISQFSIIIIIIIYINTVILAEAC